MAVAMANRRGFGEEGGHSTIEWPLVESCLHMHNYDENTFKCI